VAHYIATPFSGLIHYTHSKDNVILEIRQNVVVVVAAAAAAAVVVNSLKVYQTRR